MFDVALQLGNVQWTVAPGAMHIEEPHPVGHLAQANAAPHIMACQMHKYKNGVERCGRQHHVVPHHGWLRQLLLAPRREIAAQATVEVGNDQAMQLNGDIVHMECALMPFLQSVARQVLGKQLHGTVERLSRRNKHIDIARHAVQRLRITSRQPLALEQPSRYALALQHREEPMQATVHVAVAVLGLGRHIDHGEIDGLRRSAIGGHLRQRVGKKSLARLLHRHVDHPQPRSLIGHRCLRLGRRWHISPQRTSEKMQKELFSLGKSFHNE